jgi:site-specific recombinase XerC
VIDFFRGFMLASNTVASYRTQFNNLIQICDRYGIDLSRPLDEHDLSFVTAAYAEGHKFTTVAHFLSAVAFYTRQLFNQELPRGRLFNETLTGLRKYYGDTNVSTPKAALTLGDLSKFSQVLDTRYFEHARDWCACLLAFFGLLRINEYMGGGLRMRHVRIASYGLDVTIIRSKTSNVPAVISMTSRSDSLCPVRALRSYLAFFPALGLPHRPDDALFISRLQGSSRIEIMSDAEFISRVRAVVGAAFPDRDTARYAGHSFRRGGASALQEAGVPAALIQQHGRWASDAFRRYLDSSISPVMRLLPTRGLLPSPSS